jgi:two-component system sensor histidine kinase ChvG
MASTKLKTSPPLAIAGREVRQAPAASRFWLRRIGASLKLKGAALLVIFIALPIALYSQFESAERQRKELIVRGIQHRNVLISEILRPAVQTVAPQDFSELNGRLERFANGAAILKLLFRPDSAAHENAFLYVASAPASDSLQPDIELARLQELGVLERLHETCATGMAIDLSRPAGANNEEVLTSVLPIMAANGCWVLISAQPTAAFLNMSIDKPYWLTPEMQAAGIFYFAALVVALLIAGSMWQSLNRFRRVAREIRHGRDPKRQFSERNVVPELTPVAADLDSLVEDLRRTAEDIRLNAEENAHSLKGHVSSIDMALPALQKVVPESDQKAVRSLQIIRTSLDRLQTQISTSLRLDFTKASLLEAPRRRIDLTGVVAELLLHYRDLASENSISVVRKLDEDVFATGAEGAMEISLECVLDNALSFAPKGTTISVTLKKRERDLVLRIDDEGPGVDPDLIDRIFERSISSRPNTHGSVADSHAGLGLWIARQNVQSMGGTITARNRVGGGLSVEIILPLAD